MSASNLRDVIAAPDAAAVLAEFIRCIGRGYESALDNYDKESKGSDARTFGLDRYTFIWAQARKSKRIKVTPTERYWFELGDALVACNAAVGAGSGIEERFPRRRTGWPTTSVLQKDFAFEPQPGVTRNILVLAHIGTPEDGLQEVHICRPVVDEAGRLVRWAETVCLWSRAADQTRPIPVAPTPPDPRAPTENQAPARATAKKKDKKKDKGNKDDK